VIVVVLAVLVEVIALETIDMNEYKTLSAQLSVF
jgi:hypothetical protein